MRTDYVVIVALFLLGSAAAPPALAAGDETVTLTVSVVDGDGDPVPDAELTARWEGGEATERTRSNGQALIDVPAGSDVRIAVAHDDYVRNEPYRLTDAAGGDVTVEVAPKGSAVVQVTDGDRPLADARVTVSRDGDAVAEGTTGDNGAFTTGTIEQGSYELHVVKPGYYAIDRTLSVSGDVLRTASIERGTATVRVRVVDDHFDPPRRLGGTVRIGSLATLNTSEDGGAAVGVPVNSEFEVRVSKDGYRSTTERLAVGEADRSVTYDVRRTPALTATPANSRVVVDETVRVEVTDEYGEPVAGAAILLDGQKAATTDERGVARVGIDAAGEHELVARHDGVSADPAVVEGVRPGADTDADATATPTATPDPTPTAESTTGAAGPGFTGPLAVLAVAVALAGAAGLRGRR
ncbi:carboxypeptidase regulatory-like domain-containing protein [Halobacteriales archaeon QS_5_70_17]|nr:MAG: carboxypeptidase regulatory-like domain-containing protein [Halobacteriales archaeon QS_5_70_17]